MASTIRFARIPLRQLSIPATTVRVPPRRFLQTTTAQHLPSPLVRPIQRQQWILLKGVRASTPAKQLHTSPSRHILPPPPQHIEGTVNDPVIVPEAAPAHGSYHWAFERLISAALIPLTIAPFAAGTLHPTWDAIFCATILIHTHIGFESIIIDYIPVKEYPRARWIFMQGLKVATLAVAVGLYEFETNDVGLTEAVKRIWMA